MPDSQAADKAAPQIALQQVTTKRDRVTGFWRIRWTITNDGKGTLTVVAVHLPHGQFKSDEHRFAPALTLAPGQSEEFETFVRCDEPAGLVTENGFVIFSVIWSGKKWRIFVRIRVVVDSDGKPETAIELITTQIVGFSGAAA